MIARPRLARSSSSSAGFRPSVFGELPTEVVASLYLGEICHTSERVIRALNITHVVNCAAFGEESANPPPGIKAGNYLPLRIPDVPTYDITPHLEDTVKFIQSAILGRRNSDGERVGGTVLVHCQLGVSRSASMVIAYLMATEPFCRRFDDAYAFVRRKRPVINPNLGFCGDLKAWPELLTQRQYRDMCEPPGIADDFESPLDIDSDIDMDLLLGR